jgi:hypothetical protein
LKNGVFLLVLACMYVDFKIWGITKEAFIVDSMKIILANSQLYTWQYVQFAQNAMAHYHNEIIIEIY